MVHGERTMNSDLKLDSNTDYNLVIDGPGLRNAFYAGVLKAFQEKNIALPKTILTWSGGIPIAVAYLLGMNMEKILTWSKEAFPVGIVDPEKIQKMYGGFCELIYAANTPAEVKEKLKPLKMLATKTAGLEPHIFENFSGEREELMKAMIASAGIPWITQKFGNPVIDGQFTLSAGKIVPEEIIVHGQGGIPRITLSVSTRVGSTISLPDEHKVCGWRKVRSKGTLSYNPQKAQELYDSGYKTGLRYLGE
ncbi:hypothetical protein KA057_04020 [Candidatus Gracilibacteria bacterium]|nr:hypothetical protein [Candidatus Gracilibacteria bacterium]